MENEVVKEILAPLEEALDQVRSDLLRLFAKMFEED